MAHVIVMNISTICSLMNASNENIKCTSLLEIHVFWTRSFTQQLEMAARKCYKTFIIEVFWWAFDTTLLGKILTIYVQCRFVEEQVRGEVKRAASSRFVYQFADNNPYVGHPNPLKEGQDLFRRGLLSEAVLALEAEVLKNPDNAEGWRLLGITHAENDDDRQVCLDPCAHHDFFLQDDCCIFISPT